MAKLFCMLRAVVINLVLYFSALSAIRAQPCTLETQMKNLGLINLQTVISGIQVDLRYSGKNNFLGKDIYGCLSTAYAQPMMAEKLKKAAGFLREKQPAYRLLVYDAARPLACQWALWNTINLPESRKHIYVANPRKGSIHNYGCAIDLSIADGSGKEIDMGTGFDFFGDLAQPRCESRLLKEGKLSKAQVANRKLLRECMLKAGFTGTTSEWWHFNSTSLGKAKARYKIIP